MINIVQHGTKILASHFAATMKAHQKTEELAAFVYHQREQNEYQDLKQWWDDMDALQVIRYAEYQLRNKTHGKGPDPISKLSVGEDGIVLFADDQIGKVYNYYRTVLPQEIQIRLAYDTLIERFMEFLQQEKCAIRLFENQLTVGLFIPATDFQLTEEWQRFVQLAYSEKELYKSFTLFVNSMKLTNRGFGYVHFPSVTEAMKLWQAAFYIATLWERVVRYPDNYRKAKTDEDREFAAKENGKELRQLLTELRGELQTSIQGSDASNETGRLFDKALKLSYQFNRTGATQFSYGTVKPRARKGKIEDKIIEILSEQVRPLSCPFASVDETEQAHIHSAGDTVKNRCYSCGRHLPLKAKPVALRANWRQTDLSSRILRKGCNLEADRHNLLYASTVLRSPSVVRLNWQVVPSSSVCRLQTKKTN